MELEYLRRRAGRLLTAVKIGSIPYCSGVGNLGSVRERSKTCLMLHQLVSRFGGKR